MAIKTEDLTPPETTTSPATLPNLPLQETNKTSFEAPQNWGTPEPSTSTNSVGVNPRVELQTSTPPVIATAETDSPPSVLKIILISLALILLGVLLGVLAAKFYSPPTPAKNNSLANNISNSTEDAAKFASISAMANIPTNSLGLAPTPMATPSSLLGVQWKTKIVKSLVPNQLSFKLSYPSSWTIKSSINTSSKLEITLMQGKNIFGVGQSNDDTNPYRKCNFDSKKELADSINLGTYSEIESNSLVWRIAPSILQGNGGSESYFVCEKDNMGEFISPTAIGMVGLEIPANDQKVLDEFKYILQKIEIMGSGKDVKPTTTSATLKDLSS